MAVKKTEMDQIITEVKKVVSNWRDIAAAIDIPRNEVEIMAVAFQ